MLAVIGTFLMGGFETTAHTLSFMLFCIAHHAGVQDSIVAELGALGLLSKYGKHVAQKLQCGDLQHLTYLGAVLQIQCRCFLWWPAVPGEKSIRQGALLAILIDDQAGMQICRSRHRHRTL